MILPRHPVSEFPASKINNLKEKYFSIPVEYLSYYPSMDDVDLANVTPSERAAIRAAEALGGSKRKRIGRPSMDKEVKVNNAVALSHISSVKIAKLFYR